jgi:hypothetical protein
MVPLQGTFFFLMLSHGVALRQAQDRPWATIFILYKDNIILLQNIIINAYN